MKIHECWDAIDISFIRAAIKSWKGHLWDVFVADGNNIEHVRFECTHDTIVKLTLLHVDGYLF